MSYTMTPEEAAWVETQPQWVQDYVNNVVLDSPATGSSNSPAPTAAPLPSDAGMSWADTSGNDNTIPAPAPATPAQPAAPPAPAAVSASAAAPKPVGDPIYKLDATGEIIAGTKIWGSSPPAGVTLVGYGTPPQQQPNGTVKPAVIEKVVAPPPAAKPTALTNPANATAPNGQPVAPQQVLKDFLESDPKLMLGMAMNAFRAKGASPVFMNWFSRNFDTFWTQYLGHLAASANAGQIPTGSFVEFVQSLDPTGQFFGGVGGGGLGGTNRFAQYAAGRTS